MSLRIEEIDDRQLCLDLHCDSVEVKLPMIRNLPVWKDDEKLDHPNRSDYPWEMPLPEHHSRR